MHTEMLQWPHQSTLYHEFTMFEAESFPQLPYPGTNKYGKTFLIQK